jgi:hypothetical protein
LDNLPRDADNITRLVFFVADILTQRTIARKPICSMQFNFGSHNIIAISTCLRVSSRYCDDIGQGLAREHFCGNVRRPIGRASSLDAPHTLSEKF